MWFVSQHLEDCFIVCVCNSELPLKQERSGFFIKLFHPSNCLYTQIHSSFARVLAIFPSLWLLVCVDMYFSFFQDTGCKGNFIQKLFVKLFLLTITGTVVCLCLSIVLCVFVLNIYISCGRICSKVFKA